MPKVDAEGFDPPVLFGAPATLAKTRVVVFECSQHWKQGGSGHGLSDVVRYLCGKGFLTFQVGDSYFMDLAGDMWDRAYDDCRVWSNCMAVRPDHPDPVRSLATSNLWLCSCRIADAA
eukprot:gene7195-6797_t